MEMDGMEMDGMETLLRRKISDDELAHPATLEQPHTGLSSFNTAGKVHLRGKVKKILYTHREHY